MNNKKNDSDYGSHLFSKKGAQKTAAFVKSPEKVSVFSEGMELSRLDYIWIVLILKRDQTAIPSRFWKEQNRTRTFQPFPGRYFTNAAEKDFYCFWPFCSQWRL